MPEPIFVEVLISGKVQGVGFRAATAQQARKLEVDGWVCNLPSGRVKAVFGGDKPAVEQMIAWCRRGPPAAVVESVSVNLTDEQNIQGFEIRY